MNNQMITELKNKIKQTEQEIERIIHEFDGYGYSQEENIKELEDWSDEMDWELMSAYHNLKAKLSVYKECLELMENLKDNLTDRICNILHHEGFITKNGIKDDCHGCLILQEIEKSFNTQQNRENKGYSMANTSLDGVKSVEVSDTESNCHLADKQGVSEDLCEDFLLEKPAHIQGCGKHLHNKYGNDYYCGDISWFNDKIEYCEECKK